MFDVFGGEDLAEIAINHGNQNKSENGTPLVEFLKLSVGADHSRISRIETGSELFDENIDIHFLKVIKSAESKVYQGLRVSGRSIFGKK